jgi:hypothetical protein
MDFPASARVELDNRKLCEDCYMDGVARLKACDPWAVQAARGTAGGGQPKLLPLQERMRAEIKKRGRIRPAELAGILKVELGELEKNFAILRHMELLRGCQGADKQVYWTLFAE